MSNIVSCQRRRRYTGCLVLLALMLAGCRASSDPAASSEGAKATGTPSSATAQMAAARAQADKSGMADKYSQQAQIEQQRAKARTAGEKH